MPMYTRSTTKRLMELGNGIHAFNSLSDTGEGIHTQFVYDYNPHQSSKSLSLSNDGSLSSSFSSESSSDQSINFSFDGSLSSISSTPEPSMWDSYHDQPRNTSNPPRPLQRTSLQRWVRDPETGELRAMLESNSWPPAHAASSGRYQEANEEEIFEREYQTTLQNRDYMTDLTKKLIAFDQLEEDMAHDTLQMFTLAHRPPPPVEEAHEVASGPKPKPLGPEGTELVDENFRPPPGEVGVYPKQWVTHQSTLLRPQPTELNMSH